jgi:hypothetical protein
MKDIKDMASLFRIGSLDHNAKSGLQQQISISVQA